MFALFWRPCIFVHMMSLDKSFEIQRGDQNNWKFTLQANYFCCHLESEYTNAQHANVQRMHVVQYTSCKWILSVAQNYAMEWCHRFFQNIIRMFWFVSSFGWKFLFIESYLPDSCWFIIMATIASKHKLNTESVKDKKNEVASCCKVQYT